MDIVFLINSGSETDSPHSFNWAVIRCSSELNEAKFQHLEIDPVVARLRKKRSLLMVEPRMQQAPKRGWIVHRDVL